MDVLSGYQNKAFAPLDEVAVMLGFPGKIGMHGDKVHQEYLDGNLKKIRDYCETDVLNTYGIYLHFEHMRGTLSTAEHQRALDNLAQYLATESHKSHFSEFLEHWRR